MMPRYLNSFLTFISPKKADHDFLSSIEVVIVDQADALTMQNWDHVTTIFEHLNLQPKEAHDCDFSRVRSWYLDGKAKYLRQTLVFSAFNTPDINHLYLNHMLNVAGKGKIGTTSTGSSLNLGPRIKQTFLRFESRSPSVDPDSRFEYFVNAIVPSIAKHTKSVNEASEAPGLLLFVPSYLDFVRLRNYLAASAMTSHMSVGCVSEYSSAREVARARSHFLTGRNALLLYSERAHHFRRYQIKGVKNVIMYGLPENPKFYEEVGGEYLRISLRSGSIPAGQASIRTLFSRWDALKIERIVGSQRIDQMMKGSKGDTFDFV